MCPIRLIAFSLRLLPSFASRPLHCLVSCASLSYDTASVFASLDRYPVRESPFVCVGVHCACVLPLLLYQGYTIPMASLIRTARAGRPVSIASVGRGYSTAGTLRPVLRASTSTGGSYSSVNLVPYLSARGFASTMAGKWFIAFRAPGGTGYVCEGADEMLCL